VWGAATASHQAEGDTPASDWWRFEREPGRVQNFFNYPLFAQEKKSDHWRRFSDDIRRMRELGLTGYRFSIDWSRVEPREGAFDDASIARYAEICGELRAAGIRPCVTLFHWSSPDWIWDHAREEVSGWYDPRIVDRFERFCARIVPALAPHVDLFCTLNEPNIFLYGAFSEGILAPGHRRDDADLVPVLRHLLFCHTVAHQVIKAARPDAEVGIAQHLQPFEPESRFNAVEALMAAQVEQQFSWSIPDAIAEGRARLRTRSGRLHVIEVPGLAGTADFLGVNYYERALVRVPGLRVDRVEVLHDHRSTKEIWPREIYARGFLEVLSTAARRYKLPLYVTENGRAHPDDRERERFLHEHLRALGWAVAKQRIDVRGYFYWSLLDNLEWANGFLPRLGLYEVDYASGERTLRGTGRAYAEVVRAGEVRT
jgi:beta-glucosidase